MQEPLGSEVFIKVWPVYSVPRSGNAPVRPLLCRRMQQTWIPSQRNRYNSSVEKINAERVVSNAYVPDSFTCFTQGFMEIGFQVDRGPFGLSRHDSTS